MTFGKIDQIILLGGSRCTAELAAYLIQNSKIRIQVFTAPRQLNDIIFSDGRTFKLFFESNRIPLNISENINEDKLFLESINTSTLAIGLGEAWSFSKQVIQKFDGRLVDLMGIRMPQYRGGAHYSWQILRGNKIGACNIQLINEDMIQGVFDSGEIIKFNEYFFPLNARVPDDYFEHAVNEEIRFVKEFIDEIAIGHNFIPFKLQENFSMYFPRLHTISNAFLDWNWSTLDIEKMICAFDKPYAGVTTSINAIKVRIKGARAEFNDGPFHPFQCGLIYKIYNKALYVATLDGTIIISDVFDENGVPILNSLVCGDRFFTPREWIETALTNKIKF